MTQTVKKIVVAYSGGLDTSVILPWLQENYDNCEIIAFVADVGQGAEELDDYKMLNLGHQIFYTHYRVV